MNLFKAEITDGNYPRPDQGIRNFTQTSKAPRSF